MRRATYLSVDIIQTTIFTLAMEERNALTRNQLVRPRTKPYSKVDLSYLEDMSGGDAEFMIEVIEMFQESAPGSVQMVMVDLKNGNFPQLRATVHKLKPSVQMLGHTELYLLAAHIEEQCTGLKEGVADIDAELHQNIIKFCNETNVLLRTLEQVVADLRAR